MSDIYASGRELHERFKALGNMAGMTSDQIIAAVGNPSSVSSMAHGQILLQWQGTGCHMALLFGPDGKLLKITHEYARYAPAPDGCLTTLLFGVGILLGLGMLLSHLMS